MVTVIEETIDSRKSQRSAAERKAEPSKTITGCDNSIHLWKMLRFAQPIMSMESEIEVIIRKYPIVSEDTFELPICFGYRENS